MKVEYLSRFSKDLDNVKSDKLKNNIFNVIEEIKLADSINDLHHIKKLKGHKLAYRIKIGDYRLGVFIIKDTVELARFVHRKDIYKYFP